MAERVTLAPSETLSLQKRSWSCGTTAQQPIIDVPEHLTCVYWILHRRVSSMMEQCAILVVSSLFLGYDGSVPNVAIMIFVLFAIMGTSIICDTDFFASPHREARGSCWSLDERAKRYKRRLFSSLINMRIVCYIFYQFIFLFRSQFAVYFPARGSYEVWIGSGRIRMVEMVVAVKLTRYKTGPQLAHVQLHMLFGTTVPRTCTELVLKEWSASYYLCCVNTSRIIQMHSYFIYIYFFFFCI